MSLLDVSVLLKQRKQCMGTKRKHSTHWYAYILSSWEILKSSFIITLYWPVQKEKVLFFTLNITAPWSVSQGQFSFQLTLVRANKIQLISFLQEGGGGGLGKQGEPRRLKVVRPGAKIPCRMGTTLSSWYRLRYIHLNTYVIPTGP